MSKQTYGEHLYDYLSSLDYEGLNFEEAEARTWVAEVEALLRVARAADAFWLKADGSTLYSPEFQPINDELEQALKEVEHLLD